MSHRSDPKVGEHFVLGFRGVSLPGWVRDFEAEFGLGGLILFDRDLETGGPRNVESPLQVAALCSEIHALASRPLTLVDQEGGKVRRLKPDRGFRELPSAAALAALAHSEAERVVAESYREMAALGIDINLAPVVDLDTNPDNPNIGALERCFSADPREVRRCVGVLAVAAARCGLGLCLKHYPGLGGAVTDSHSGLTDLTGSFSDEQVRLFVDLQERIPGSAILLSHGMVRNWDPDWPVSISAAAVSALRAMTPDALLITDDVQMGGLQDVCSTLEGSRRALTAGVDLVCIGNNLRVEEAECFEAARALAEAANGDEPLRQRLALARTRIRARKPAAAAGGGAADSGAGAGR